MFIDDSFYFELFKFFETIVVEVITCQLIFKWFQTKLTLKQSDTNNIAFTVKGKLENGNYNICQGIFNTTTEDLLHGIKWEGKEIDEELEKLHQDRPLVIYS